MIVLHGNLESKKHTINILKDYLLEKYNSVTKQVDLRDLSFESLQFILNKHLVDTKIKCFIISTSVTDFDDEERFFNWLKSFMLDNDKVLIIDYNHKENKIGRYFLPSAIERCSDLTFKCNSTAGLYNLEKNRTGLIGDNINIFIMLFELDNLLEKY